MATSGKWQCMLQWSLTVPTLINTLVAVRLWPRKISHESFWNILPGTWTLCSRDCAHTLHLELETRYFSSFSLPPLHTHTHAHTHTSTHTHTHTHTHSLNPLPNSFPLCRVFHFNSTTIFANFSTHWKTSLSPWRCTPSPDNPSLKRSSDELHTSVWGSP